jgi:hypothetical protein
MIRMTSSVPTPMYMSRSFRLAPGAAATIT